MQRTAILFVLALTALGLTRTGAAQQASPAQEPSTGIDFSDKPNFTVSGVTDWTAVGGHGSDAILRTSEDLARETRALEAEKLARQPVDAAREQRLRAALGQNSGDLEANRELGEYYLHLQRFSDAVPLLRAASRLSGAQPEDEYHLALACKGLGDLKEARAHIERALAAADIARSRRVAGDIDEALGDPLLAVHNYERAASLEPSEENYLAWGSELLLHRAVWQAADVFRTGSTLHPGSAPLLSGLATALFSGARYADAARAICQASDAAPTGEAPYLFMGKIQQVSPVHLPCIEERLRRYLDRNPDDAAANYLYAMALLGEGSAGSRQQAESLLGRATHVDPAYAPAYLQLGTLAFDRKDYAGATEFFRRAIAANPRLSEAHFRLAVACDRAGNHQEAQQEYARHAALKQAEEDAVETQRRQIKQFEISTRH